MDGHECHDVSLKELPTREQKLRRNKDRRDCPTLPPIRLRLKSCTSPPHDIEQDKFLSDRSISSSPDSINLHLSPNSAFNSYDKYITHVEPSHPSPLPIITKEGGLVDASNYSHEMSSGLDCVVDNDQPLDMSTKRVQNNTLHDTSSNQIRQQRPSVITCASALLRTPCNLNDVSHKMCTVAVTDSRSADIEKFQENDDSDSSCVKKDVKQDVIRPGHRREIVSGSCDPVIDEHFRRSLGKDYQQIFHKSSTNSISITVDDHFAKALGDTWLQLQSKSTSPNTSQPSQTQTLHSKQQSQFLQHSPEIVST